MGPEHAHEFLEGFQPRPHRGVHPFLQMVFRPLGLFVVPEQLKGFFEVLESTEFQPLSQPQVPRFAWSSDCASMRSRGGTAVLELLATPARAVIIAADPGRRARCRGLPGTSRGAQDLSLIHISEPTRRTP